MLKDEIQLSEGFKVQAKKAVLAIVLFAFTYLLMIALAVGLTVGCVFGGIMLVVTFPHLITIILGIGLASCGVLVLIFLLKFIFSSKKVDRSHFTEITKKDEPKLFSLIEQIVLEVGTDFPKKVYLSSDVNASVFYDSNFWSMFFPIKKNLNIGMGLINTVTEEELTAILAHEFGHFSQKTMKVGSYVYNVNHVIHNMLVDNDSYGNIVRGWAEISGYFYFFVKLAIAIVQGIQWILQKMYGIVNLRYLSLSREMEFHADEIASHVAGYVPLKNSLLRLDLASTALNTVISHYEGKIADCVASKNIFQEQKFVMDLLAKESELEFENGLPKVGVEDLNKYNKSKLVIKDQWASHPSVEDRIEVLERNNILPVDSKPQSANVLFENAQATQEQLTKKLFDGVEYKEEAKSCNFEDFKTEFVEARESNSFHEAYNSYYDYKQPENFELDKESEKQMETPDFQALFSDEKLDLIYTSLSLKNDIETLTQIADKQLDIKTFDYDGVKHKASVSKKLAEKLTKELDKIDRTIKNNDLLIFHYFKNKTKVEDDKSKLIQCYQDFFKFESKLDKKMKVYGELMESLEFINYSLPHEEIHSNFLRVSALEKKLKKQINKLMEDERLKSEIDAEMLENFETYLSKDWRYFGRESYFQGHLQMLFKAAHDYTYLVSRAYFIRKKQLLDFQMEVEEA